MGKTVACEGCPYQSWMLYDPCPICDRSIAGRELEDRLGVGL